MPSSSPSFDGLRVVAFESRMAGETADLIARYGGVATVAPSMREVPLDRHPAVETFAQELSAGQVDVAILLTGVGTRVLIESTGRFGPGTYG